MRDATAVEVLYEQGNMSGRKSWARRIDEAQEDARLSTRLRSFLPLEVLKRIEQGPVCFAAYLCTHNGDSHAQNATATAHAVARVS